MQRDGVYLSPTRFCYAHLLLETMRWNLGADGFFFMIDKYFNVLIPLLLPRPFSGPGKVPC
jgi:hypothetical protein